MGRLVIKAATMKHENVAFTDSDVELDEFIKCKFTNCNLDYRGGKVPMIRECSFDRPRISLADAAENTLGFMYALYHGGFKIIIEATFDNIRKHQPDGSVIFGKNPDIVH
jgi:hypothetical protein